MTRKEKNYYFSTSTKYAVDMLSQCIHNNFEIVEMLEWLEEHDITYKRVVATFYFTNEHDKTLFVLRFK